MISRVFGRAFVAASVRLLNQSQVRTLPVQVTRLISVYPPVNVKIHPTKFSQASLNQDEVKKGVESISEKFTEAMDLLNDARSSLGTVYFSDDMTDAEAQVNETLDEYKSLLDKLNEDQKKNVIRTIGLKMEELRAQLDIIREEIRENPSNAL